MVVQPGRGGEATSRCCCLQNPAAANVPGILAPAGAAPHFAHKRSSHRRRLSRVGCCASSLLHPDLRQETISLRAARRLPGTASRALHLSTRSDSTTTTLPTHASSPPPG